MSKRDSIAITPGTTTDPYDGYSYRTINTVGGTTTSESDNFTLSTYKAKPEELSRSEVFPEYQDFWKLTHRLEGALDMWFDTVKDNDGGVGITSLQYDEYYQQFSTSMDYEEWEEAGRFLDLEMYGMAAVLKHGIISFEELCEWMDYYEKHLLRFDQVRWNSQKYGSVTPVWFKWYDAWKLFRERYEKAEIRAEVYHG